MKWEPIKSAPKDPDKLSDIWCVPPDGDSFTPERGGIRLTDVYWSFENSGWARLCDDGDEDLIESGPTCPLGLPPWTPTHWMPVPDPPPEEE